MADTRFIGSLAEIGSSAISNGLETMVCSSSNSTQPFQQDSMNHEVSYIIESSLEESMNTTTEY